VNRKVWLIEEVTYDHDREVDRHQPIAVYAAEADARQRALRETRETVVSELWLFESIPADPGYLRGPA